MPVPISVGFEKLRVRQGKAFAFGQKRHGTVRVVRLIPICETEAEIDLEVAAIRECAPDIRALNALAGHGVFRWICEPADLRKQSAEEDECRDGQDPTKLFRQNGFHELCPPDIHA